jgi:DnaK suppressor protein
MDELKARGLLEVERRETQRRLDALQADGQADRSAANEQPGDWSDSAQPLTQEGTDDAVIEELQRHLEAIDRAERRLEAGTYGHSVRSGLPIPEERLEDDPTAELTVEEAADEP